MVKREEHKKERLPPQTFHMSQHSSCARSGATYTYIMSQHYIYLPDFYANILWSTADPEAFYRYS